MAGDSEHTVTIKVRTETEEAQTNVENFREEMSQTRKQVEDTAKAAERAGKQMGSVGEEFASISKDLATISPTLGKITKGVTDLTQAWRRLGDTFKRNKVNGQQVGQQAGGSIITDTPNGLGRSGRQVSASRAGGLAKVAGLVGIGAVGAQLFNAISGSGSKLAGFDKLNTLGAPSMWDNLFPYLQRIEDNTSRIAENTSTQITPPSPPGGAAATLIPVEVTIGTPSKEVLSQFEQVAGSERVILEQQGQIAWTNIGKQGQTTLAGLQTESAKALDPAIADAQRLTQILDQSLNGLQVGAIGVLNPVIIDVETLRESLSTVLDGMTTEAEGAIVPTIQDAQRLKEILDKALDGLEGKSAIVLTPTIEDAETLREILDQAIDQLMIESDSALDLTITDAQTLKNALDKVMDGLAKQAETVLNPTIIDAQALKAALGETIDELMQESGTALEDALIDAEALKGILDKAIDGLIEKSGGALSKVLTDADTLKITLNTALDEFLTESQGSLNTVKEQAEAIKTALDGALDGLIERSQTALSSTIVSAETLREILDSAMDEFLAERDGILSQAIADAETLRTVLNDALDTFTEESGTALADVLTDADTLKGILDTALDTFIEQSGGALSLAKEDAEILKATLNESLDELAEEAQTALETPNAEAVTLKEMLDTALDTFVTKASTALWIPLLNADSLKRKLDTALDTFIEKAGTVLDPTITDAQTIRSIADRWFDGAMASGMSAYLDSLLAKARQIRQELAMAEAASTSVTEASETVQNVVEKPTTTTRPSASASAGATTKPTTSTSTTKPTTSTSTGHTGVYTIDPYTGQRRELTPQELYEASKAKKEAQNTVTKATAKPKTPTSTTTPVEETPVVSPTVERSLEEFKKVLDGIGMNNRSTAMAYVGSLSARGLTGEEQDSLLQYWDSKWEDVKTEVVQTTTQQQSDLLGDIGRGISDFFSPITDPLADAMNYINNDLGVGGFLDAVKNTPIGYMAPGLNTIDQYQREYSRQDAEMVLLDVATSIIGGGTAGKVIKGAEKVAEGAAKQVDDVAKAAEKVAKQVDDVAEINAGSGMKQLIKNGGDAGDDIPEFFAVRDKDGGVHLFSKDQFDRLSADKGNLLTKTDDGYTIRARQADLDSYHRSTELPDPNYPRESYWDEEGTYHVGLDDSGKIQRDYSEPAKTAGERLSELADNATGTVKKGLSKITEATKAHTGAINALNILTGAGLNFAMASMIYSMSQQSGESRFMGRASTDENGATTYTVNGIEVSEDAYHNIFGFAQGGVFMPNQPQLAVLGDNRTEPEVVAPYSMIVKAVTEAIQSAGSSSGGGGFGGERQPAEAVVTLDGKVIARAIFDDLENERRRRSRSVPA